MSKKRSGKNIISFASALLIYIGILLLVIIGVLVYLWISLSKYQSGIDESAAQTEYEEKVSHAPQNVFMSYVSGLSETDWTNLWYETHPEHFDSSAVVNDIMNKTFINGDVNYYKSDDSTQENPRFLIKNSEGTLVVMTLTGSGTDYAVTDTEFMIEGDYASSVTAPKGSTVYINEIELGAEYITESVADVPMKEYSDSVNNPVVYDTYVINGLLSEPEIRIEGDRSLVLDSDDRYKYVLSEDESGAIVDKADSFIRALLHYYWLGKSDSETNMNAALSKVASNSEASRLIRISIDGIIWRPSYPGVTCDISNGPVYVLADNCYCVDVSYVPYGTAGSDIEAGAYRVFFLDTGKGMNIYNFELRQVKDSQE